MSSGDTSLLRRLPPILRSGTLWGWVGPLIVTIFGAFLRFERLGKPEAIVFDEAHYVKQAVSLLRFGIERETLRLSDDNNTNDKMIAERLVSGDADIFVQCAGEMADRCAMQAVHPPLGKWMIALGEWLFSLNSFGWRFGVALFGTLSILILARTARRMTGSTLLGCLAGFLLALDGLHYVLSRSALLDVFLTFWIIAAFACLVADRDDLRRRFDEWDRARAVAPNGAEWLKGPRLGVRPWRIGMGICLGLALAVKWNAIFFIVAFVVISLFWDAGVRKAKRLPRPVLQTLGRQLPGAAGTLAVTSGVSYTLTWTGWFVSAHGYARNWADAVDGGPFHFVVSTLRSWVTYHVDALRFHSGLSTHHSYMSEPWQWPILARPVLFHHQREGVTGCGTTACAETILGVGTPAIWWGGLVALVVMIAWYVATRDWRAGTVLLMYGVGWFPWFYYAIAHNRTMYQFYALPMLPFLILALVFALGLLIGPGGSPTFRRAAGASIAGTYTLLVLINFWWLYPVLGSVVTTVADWYARMWFSSWV
ncbi:dolichyl-phosphate-mannose--protein mannosyltransferase [Rhizohabitans arisaemae]|uniref:dolichyl-phosphate-mannose--protein mannosyltransferase n=1 Tax=Rhizohabitans arisaemae TaxID=2720610 RepID=UPI0024B14413|nr:phospholipid carrier-dependent glycosyltransferase [Rhizohabitans arisaemae]